MKTLIARNSFHFKNVSLCHYLEVSSNLYEVLLQIKTFPIVCSKCAPNLCSNLYPKSCKLMPLPHQHSLEQAEILFLVENWFKVEDCVNQLNTFRGTSPVFIQMGELFCHKYLKCLNCDFHTGFKRRHSSLTIPD